MKKLFSKLPLLFMPLFIYLFVVYVNDIFNVFHYDNIRQISASSDENYIKTRYILDNPDKFNAFILGSSRVGNLPIEGLPEQYDGDSLSWYNMTYPMGCPRDNLETIKTFLNHGVDIKYVVIGIDEISMYRRYQDNSSELIYTQYQEYERSPLSFFYSYLKVKPDFALLKEALSQSEQDKLDTKLFYEYGVERPSTDLSIPEGNLNMVSSLGCGYYGPDESVESIREIADICKDNDIELKIFTSPILETTYREAVDKGYLHYLKDVADCTEFYNFSGLNEYTTDMRFYFDASHYRPYVGILIEKCLFADTVDRDVRSFGGYVSKDNVDDLIARLEEEIVE
ncbi:hypothetical protein [Butyrivibrio proteoclasticus]|uniref:hypothetical protein n=1 Tax=Butyrivibrio proteoclasticus TaxID=43305 RepID=UPI00047895FA|nr:hypothetical protein [Butyrivibrio proteoclasticus]